jgi:hypothetical protein
VTVAIARYAVLHFCFFPQSRFCSFFGAVERDKYLYLPYLDSTINERFFLNGERIRTWHSWLNEIPGLFASTLNASDSLHGSDIFIGIEVNLHI